ncbi:hypothetical protein [Halorussus lipolyticus]|uniref:hypothetical protein n=1 Tax=Halorussus lipolyticus TaxID=3034024 RepID=UPI0023E7F409|nr:hypothetical protein [Halorussus sp. DT80]
MASDTHDSRRWEKGALLVGFVSLAVAVLVAHGSPPETYELSIYAETPLAFWLGAGTALLVGVFVGLRGAGRPRKLALALGGLSALAIASVPVLRSYYFFGAGDSLTHLGWAKDIASGRMGVLDLLYPGTHTIAIFLSDATGMALNRAILVMIMAFSAVFLVFLPLATWTMTHSRLASATAALSGFLLLPITNISVYQMAHPTSQAILFLPLVVFLLARYLVEADRDELLVGTPTGVLMAVASAAIVLIHPQQALNVVFVFVSILGLQVIAKWWGTREGDHPLLALQTLFIGGAFLVWAPRHERASGAASALLNMILNGPQVGGTVTQRAVSLSSIGGSVPILFVKLFLVATVFCGLAGLLILTGFLGRIEDSPDVSAFVRYLGIGLVPIGTLFTAYFVVSYEKLHFRQLGFMLVLITILGAIALSKGVERLSTRYSSGSARTALGVVMVVMLALSVPSLYQSPYMYQTSSHVTEAQMNGFETAIEYKGSAPLIGIRGSGERWSDAVLGYQESRERKMAVGSLYANEKHPAVDENFTGEYIARHYEDRYLAYTDRAKQQDLQVYDGFRFDRDGFRSLDSTPGLSRVETNGGVQVYLTASETNSTA